MGKRVRMTVPAAWQFDGSQLASESGRIQLWSAGGCMQGTVDIARARELVAAGAYFLGSSNYLCQVHERIDTRNRAA